MADSIAIASLASITSGGVSAQPATASKVTINAPTAAVAGISGNAQLTLDNPQVAEQVQAYLQANGLDMKFSVDDETKQTIVRIYNSSSGELVRQVPTEDMVRLARALRAGQNQTLAIEV